MSRLKNVVLILTVVAIGLSSSNSSTLAGLARTDTMFAATAAQPYEQLASASRDVGAANITSGYANKPAVPLTPVGSGFTYQGQLKDGANPANGQYDMQFSLYDALTGGTLISGPITATNQTVNNGLFTTNLDFGMSAFQGDARWLQIAVRQSGGGSYTTLSPRQALTATPYALSLMPGAYIQGTSSSSAMLSANNNSGYGGYFSSGGSIGLLGVGSSGVYGWSTSAGGYGVWGKSNSGGTAVYGENSSTGNGVYGQSNSGYGVYGTSNSVAMYGAGGDYGGTFSGSVFGVSGLGSTGIYGASTGGGGYGVWGQSNSANAAVYGENSSTGSGVWGLNYNGRGVYGQSNSDVGVYGTSLSGYGGYFTGGTGTGLFGSSSAIGVSGFSSGGGSVAGVWGSTIGANGNGVVGEANNGASAYGVWGRSTSGYAGYFSGNVQVSGNLSKGGGSFKIDHPLDPENKYLYHSFVESPDMMDIYNGNITLDSKGEAVVQMPDWFDALNRDFRYQLTPIGGPGPNLYVAEKVKGNTFKIAGGAPGLEVSWQVTGIREDPYANAHRIPVEQDKPAGEKGKYLYPTEYGQPESKGIDYERRQRMEQQTPEPPHGH